MTYFSEHAQGDEAGRTVAVSCLQIPPRQRGQAGSKSRRRQRQQPTAKRPAPGISDDTRFFWEGARTGQVADPALQELQHAAPSARPGMPELPFIRMGHARSFRARHRVFLRGHALPGGAAI